MDLDVTTAFLNKETAVPTFEGTSNGRHVSNIVALQTEEFKAPTVTTTKGTASAPPAVSRTDKLALDWNALFDPAKPFNFMEGTLTLMTFGGNFKYQGSLELKIPKAEWRDTMNPLEPGFAAQSKSKMEYRFRSSFGFAYTNEEDVPMTLDTLRFESRSSPVPLSQLNSTATLGGATLLPTSVELNGIPGSPQSSYLLAPGGKVEFVFPGDKPLWFTAQGHATYNDPADPDYQPQSGFAVQVTEVPEPAGWCLALVAAAAWLLQRGAVA